MIYLFGIGSLGDLDLWTWQTKITSCNFCCVLSTWCQVNIYILSWNSKSLDKCYWFVRSIEKCRECNIIELFSPFGANSINDRIGNDFTLFYQNIVWYVIYWESINQRLCIVCKSCIQKMSKIWSEIIMLILIILHDSITRLTTLIILQIGCFCHFLKAEKQENMF